MEHRVDRPPSPRSHNSCYGEVVLYDRPSRANEGRAIIRRGPASYREGDDGEKGRAIPCDNSNNDQSNGAGSAGAGLALGGVAVVLSYGAIYAAAVSVELATASAALAGTVALAGAPYAATAGVGYAAYQGAVIAKQRWFEPYCLRVLREARQTAAILKTQAASLQSSALQAVTTATTQAISQAPERRYRARASPSAGTLRNWVAASNNFDVRSDSEIAASEVNFTVGTLTPEEDEVFEIPEVDREESLSMTSGTIDDGVERGKDQGDSYAETAAKPSDIETAQEADSMAVEVKTVHPTIGQEMPQKAEVIQALEAILNGLKVGAISAQDITVPLQQQLTLLEGHSESIP